jgi:hypothetical protein
VSLVRFGLLSDKILGEVYAEIYMLAALNYQAIMIESLLKIVPDLIKIFSKDEKPSVGVKHLILRSDEQINNLLNRDFSFLRRVENEKVYLIENDVFKFGINNFRNSVKNLTYEDWENSPYADLANKSDKWSKHFEIDDYEDSIEKHDSEITGRVIQELLDKDLPVDFSKYAKHSVYNFECWGCVCDVFEFSPMWLVALSIENMTNSPIKLSSINGIGYETNSGLEYRQFSDDLGSPVKIEYPSNQIEPGETIIIPEFFVFPSLEPVGDIELKTIDKPNWGSPAVIYHYSRIDFNALDEVNVIGPSFKPTNIEIQSKSFSVHDLDFSKMLTISEHLNYGSCPYVFGINSDGVTFLGDILTFGENVIDVSNFNRVEIHEIEEEITHIDSLYLNENLIFKNKTLVKGQKLVIDNLDGSRNKILVKGKYYAEEFSNSEFIIAYKHQLISKKLDQLKSIYTGS